MQGSGYDAPWGATLLSNISKMIGGNKGDSGLLGNQDALDSLVPGENLPPAIAYSCNLGMVDLWKTGVLHTILHKNNIEFMSVFLNLLSKSLSQLFFFFQV
jgi:hypothetical protein